MEPITLTKPKRGRTMEPKPIDIYVESFIDAAIHTFRAKFDTFVKAGKPFLKKPMELSKGPVTGTVKIAGEPRVFLAVNFSKKCILGLAPRIIGHSENFITTEIHEAVKSLAGLIAKRGRLKLYEEKIIVQTEKANLVAGERHRIDHPFRETRPTVVPFNSSFGPFAIEISLEK